MENEVMDVVEMDNVANYDVTEYSDEVTKASQFNTKTGLIMFGTAVGVGALGYGLYKLGAKCGSKIKEKTTKLFKRSKKENSTEEEVKEEVKEEV